MNAYEDLVARYAAEMHEMQTGVAVEHGHGSQDGTPKHLRVGINSALINDAALARLLIEKGVFTEDEYTEAVALEAEAEAKRYQDRIRKMSGHDGVTLR